jgi:hypothetical protein
LPPVETDDLLNAGWDGPPSWNVSAAAMTGDIVLYGPRDFEAKRRMQVWDRAPPQIIDEIHAHREAPELEVQEVGESA